MSVMTSVIPRGRPFAVVDPSGSGALTVVELDEAGYRQVAHVEGDEPFTAARPFPVTVVPARLLDKLRPE